MIEGRLTIDLYRNGNGIERAEIASTRPLGMSSLFENKAPRQVTEMLPLIFSVCGIAQGRASAAALEMAMDRPTCPATEAARDALVSVETARETLLRIVLHWPSFLGEEPVMADLKRINRLVADARNILFGARAPFAVDARTMPDRSAFLAMVDALDALISESVFGEPSTAFLARSDVAALEAWIARNKTTASRLIGMLTANGWAGAGRSDTAFLPPLDDADLLRRLRDTEADQFTARPDWSGTPRETTALARRRHEPLIDALSCRYGTGLLTRLTARLVDLALIPGELRDHAKRFTDCRPAANDNSVARSTGAGIAQVEAARGRLAHAVQIEDGHVSRYRILAPTEWNFHPEGAAARALCALTGEDETDLAGQAKLLVDAIDPCVGYELRINELEVS